MGADHQYKLIIYFYYMKCLQLGKQLLFKLVVFNVEANVNRWHVQDLTQNLFSIDKEYAQLYNIVVLCFQHAVDD